MTLASIPQSRAGASRRRSLSSSISRSAAVLRRGRARTPPRILFICGSINQTTEMLAIARELPGADAYFTPFYGDRGVELLGRAGVLEFTIAGNKAKQRCLALLHEHGAAVDLRGKNHDYDLVVTCSDLIVPRNVRGRPLVAVQEGMLDPAPPIVGSLAKRCRLVPRWLAGAACTGLSGLYDRFCAASEGFRKLLIESGAPAERIVVTGKPNFDDCERHRQGRFPYRGYVLVCTSDARETGKPDNRMAFLRGALAVARGRPLIVKLHPNEQVERATREVHSVAPHALVCWSGNTEDMIANCDEFVTQYSSTVFVALALGKRVHSYYDPALLKALMPVQNGSAAKNIAAVCTEVLSERAAGRAGFRAASVWSRSSPSSRG